MEKNQCGVSSLKCSHMIKKFNMKVDMIMCRYLFFSLSLQREFVAIAEKAETAKTSLKKSIADIDQVIKGLING